PAACSSFKLGKIQPANTGSIHPAVTGEPAWAGGRAGGGGAGAAVGAGECRTLQELQRQLLRHSGGDRVMAQVLMGVMSTPVEFSSDWPE
ncbi:hypothetical protein ACWKW4_23075, partial [Hydrogenophaga borbori]